jgi:molecular chaperone GrpE
VSFSDEAVPAEEVTPEAELVTDGSSDDGAEAVDGEVVEGEVVDGEVVDEVELDPVVTLEKERDEYLLALQRTQADFENYRKRIQRMQDEQSARAESDDAKALSAARSMLLDALGKEGLERLDDATVPFDPAVHDAVARTDGEGGEVVVDQILRSGYRWRGQVLRPAMVSVRG